MVKVGTVGFDLVAYTGGLTKPLRMAQRQVESFGRSIRSSIGGAMAGVRGALSSTTAQLMGLGGALTAGGLIAQAMKLAVAMEDAETAFTTFLGSGAQAKALLADLKKFSDVTPFTASQIRTAGRGLIAFGFEAERIIPTLQYLGDAAAGSQNDINELVNILGKIKAKGKLQLEELNRFTDRGINLIPELRRQLGKSKTEMSKFISAGKVGFEDVERALMSLNSEGGIFSGAMEALSRTTSGRLSTLKSAFDDVLAGIGTAMIQGLDIKGLTTRLTDMVVKYRDTAVLAVSRGVDMIMRGTTAVAEQMSAVMGSVTSLGESLSWLSLQYKLAQAGAMEFAAASVLAISNVKLNVQELANWIDYTGQQWADKLSIWFDEAVMKRILPDATFTEWQAKRQEQLAAHALAPWDKTGAADTRAFMDAFASVVIPDLEKAYFDALTSNMSTPMKAPDTGAATMEAWARGLLGSASGEGMEGMMADAIGKTSKTTAEALERGSQNAFSTILGTQQPIEQKSLEELKAQTNYLRSIESRGVVLKAAGLLMGGIQ